MSAIENELRDAIRDAEARGTTRYQIAQQADVSQTLLSLFLRTPDRHIRLDMAERIAAALGKHIRLTARRR